MTSLCPRASLLRSATRTVRLATQSKATPWTSPASCSPHCYRWMSSNLNRPAPPPLPRELQREFEDLQKAAQMPLSSSSHGDAEAGLALHPDARKPVTPEFEGESNPTTGERGGPKREPVGKWSDDGGDWSFKGRVSDF